MAYRNADGKDDQIVALRAAGKTIAEIVEKLSTSKERVRQVIAAAIAAGKLSATLPKTKRPGVTLTDEQARELVACHARGMGARAIALKLRVPESVVYRELGKRNLKTNRKPGGTLNRATRMWEEL